jgi:hypothetical protein
MGIGRYTLERLGDATAMKWLLALTIAFAPVSAQAHGVVRPTPRRPPIAPVCPAPISTPWRFSPRTERGRRDFAATISIACPANVTYELSLFSGNDCTLQADGMTIPYRIYSDAAHTSPIALCGSGRGRAALTGSGASIFTVYGEAIVPDAALDTGRYVDFITLTLNYGTQYAN